MKYVTIALLFLTACSSTPKVDNRPLHSYECAVMTIHGILVKLKVERKDIQQAYDDTETVRKRLLDKGLIGDNAFSDCFSSDGMEHYQK